MLRARLRWILRRRRASSVTSSVSSEDFFVRGGALGLGGGVCSSSSSRTTSMGSPTPSSRRLRTGDVHFMLQLHAPRVTLLIAVEAGRIGSG